MNTIRWFALVLSLVVAAPMMQACHAPVSVVTPAGQAAFTANEVLIRVERLQDAVIAASRNGSLERDLAEQIVFATVTLAEVADGAVQGWQATAREMWAQAKKDFTVLRPGGSFVVLAAAIDEALGGVQ